MEEGKIEEILNKLESAFDTGEYGAVKRLGFWNVVRVAKGDPVIAEKFAQRIGRIDLLLFESKIRNKLGYKLGTVIELIGALFGALFLYLGLSSTGFESTLYYFTSVGVLMTALHPISHSLAAWLFGIKFHFYFLNGPMLIEPTLKVDYSTYIKTPAKKRALFHLAGVINSFVVTLLLFLIVLNDPDSQFVAKFVLGALWIANTGFEVFPMLLIRLGTPRIRFLDFRKTDTYRAMREWKLGK